MTNAILEIRNLKTYFYTDHGEVPAVDGVTIAIEAGEVLGIVGESGCGKSVTSLSVMRLIPNPPGKIIDGEILYNNEDLIKATEKRMREIRGNDIAMIFQEPMTSLNPVLTIGDQVSESIRIHNNVKKKEAWNHAVKMLQVVGIPRAEQIVHEYPHQLSGGMRQRVMIAIAMSCQPKLLIADEPTTALDVTIQAQILDLMRKLNRENGTAIMMITHDLGVVAEICQRVVVMYGGQIVEQGNVSTILKNPQHPYTQGLIRSLPKIHEKEERLYSIPGNVPKPGSIVHGCRFAPRCEKSFQACTEINPDLIKLGDDHLCRCLLYSNGEGA